MAGKQQIWSDEILIAFDFWHHTVGRTAFLPLTISQENSSRGGNPYPSPVKEFQSLRLLLFWAKSLALKNDILVIAEAMTEIAPFPTKNVQVCPMDRKWLKDNLVKNDTCTNCILCHVICRGLPLLKTTPWTHLYSLLLHSSTTPKELAQNTRQFLEWGTHVTPPRMRCLGLSANSQATILSGKEKAIP